VDVSGARLYYERRGAGPLLLLIGSPMDSTGFTGLAHALADRYTVVTYDPRGIGRSTREDTTWSAPAPPPKASSPPPAPGNSAD
jgi:clorobiocin biosynthesis protein CloN7